MHAQVRLYFPVTSGDAYLMTRRTGSHGILCPTFAVTVQVEIRWFGDYSTSGRNYHLEI